MFGSFRLRFFLRNFRLHRFRRRSLFRLNLLSLRFRHLLFHLLKLRLDIFRFLQRGFNFSLLRAFVRAFVRPAFPLCDGLFHTSRQFARIGHFRHFHRLRLLRDRLSHLFHARRYFWNVDVSLRERLLNPIR